MKNGCKYVDPNALIITYTEENIMNVMDIIMEKKIVPVVVLNNLEDTEPTLNALCEGGLPIAYSNTHPNYSQVSPFCRHRKNKNRQTTYS